MMEYIIVIVFVIGYVAIALEHKIHVNKAASALVTGVICWALYALSSSQLVDWNDVAHHLGIPLSKPDKEKILEYISDHQLLEHLSEIASILFFLIGAMTIVETIDAHGGFSIITNRIHTTSRLSLMWLVSALTFFMSAVLDNLTTTIVMASLVRKIVANYKDRWLFAGMIVIAANAGGAWSPIGDVTTTMLWIGKQITTVRIITMVFLPSLFCLIVPLLLLTRSLKGNISHPVFKVSTGHSYPAVTSKEKKIIFVGGLSLLLFVPVFKAVTHLPPFMGMMLSLGIMWIATEMLHRKKPFAVQRELSVIGVIRKIDMASVLFFLGILLAVGSLQSIGTLKHLATFLDHTIGIEHKSGIILLALSIGLFSSVVDNVPLVAAAMGMYPIQPGTFFEQDGLFWEFLAYAAGTGGSALIIGSAAGVAVMGIERITFSWYFRKIAPLALIGYLSGALIYVLQYNIFH
ncbi:sodium:proton antiporter [Thermaurantimonas aggregans]|uniref:Sodium:proton antiporter n=1 Tax=Thermaurantimonas aggregans TaxID=2173829 RepID=A0A401XLX4_9FLAO|nr:sodium:proton antiporter NhaD [Thermaurantimonas aggregans]MCX8149499.1 sodium:proton antiporter NhaD [Thermaurantimonas aggregans]GCD78025.1 sodium:proton antiporter [Thermaurantimonas aggregans]